ncbi:hypothetical protein [Exiguobacterium sp. s63]|uniref:hypothetical protein n=1 Tax=Exiguobacterium sp. s63 TaxID=2751274 RepID=UPI001BEB7399|nr:hypothetical protein [Exiguobacterium sp. s63]
MKFEEFVDQMYSELPEKAQEPVRILVDGTATLAPVLGKYYHQYQHRKIDRAFKEMGPKLEKIASKIENSEETELFKEEIFPVIVSKILNEPQEEKIKVIIDGFEHLVDKNITDLDTIFHYYDVLEELRLADIVFLIKNYKPIDYSKATLNIRLEDPAEMYGLSQSERRELQERRAERKDVERYLVNKLERLGLVTEKNDDYRKSYGEPTKSPFDNIPKSFSLLDYELTPFGKRFIIFFSSIDTISDNE